MKIKNYLLGGLAALGLILTGCSNEDNDSVLEDGVGKITIKLAGSNSSPNNRAAADTNTKDSEIYNYKVYVFAHTSGVLEAAVAGNASKTTTIDELPTKTSKRVVVLTNLGDDEDYPDVNTYGELSNAQYRINLDDQNPEDAKANGYIMFGYSENPVTLIPNQTVTEEIDLYRAVAKISIETITFEPEDDTDLSKLEILAVSAQRVAPEVTLAPIRSYYNDGAEGYHYGGFISSDTKMRQRDYLADDVTLGTLPYDEEVPYDLGNYFLVFPNTTPDDCTLLTIKAKYNDEVLYYPIRVNYQTGDENTDGQFVESNKHYQLHVTLKKIADGTVDPEVPPGEGTLEVKVTVKNWSVIIQREEW